MKKTILLILVLILGMAKNAVMADFVFGEPKSLDPMFNRGSYHYSPYISPDGLEFYFSTDGGYGWIDLWVAKRTSVDEEWAEPIVLGPEVNSSQPDWAPSLTADGLLLIYMRYDELWSTTRQTKESPWEPAKRMGPPINVWDDGPGTVSPDGLSLFFSSSHSGSGDIYISTRESRSDDWGEPISLGPQINSPYDEEGAFVSVDGRVMILGYGFYSAPRPGGIGGADFWISTRATLTEPWGEPVNIGFPINTEYVEGTPSISPDGSTLYFASERPDGPCPCSLWQAPILPLVDLNGDGIVDAADMCIVVDNWGTDNSLCDIGPMPWGDGIVDVQDLIVLAGHLFEEIPPAEEVE